MAPKPFEVNTNTSYSKLPLAPMSVESVSATADDSSDLFFVSTYSDFDKLGEFA